MSKAGGEEFKRHRAQLNEMVLKHADLGIKRFFSLDDQVYRPGALPAKTKEMLGLMASLVLQCDDCVAHHLIRCHDEGLTDAELQEVLSIGLVVGGSITVPNVRRAVKFWGQLQDDASRPEEE